MSCVPNVASFSRLSILHCPSVLFVFVLCLVYPMLPVSLDCPFFIAPHICFVFVLCLVYPMLPVSLDCPFFIAPQFCLSSSCVLCAQCCQFRWIVHSSLPLSFVCLRPVSCVPNVASFSRLSILHCPSYLFVFVLCLVYPMLPVSLDCPFVIAPQFCLSSSCVLCAQCCQFLWIVHSSLPLSFVCLRPVSCVPNVASFSRLSILHCPSVLFVFVLCLVYPMLPVSLDCPFFIAPQFCLSSSCVLYTQCCQFL